MAVAVACVAAARASACEPTRPASSYQTVTTKKSRAELSQFLVAPAREAPPRRATGRTRSRSTRRSSSRAARRSPEAKQLATLWTLAGQNERRRRGVERRTPPRSPTRRSTATRSPRPRGSPARPIRSPTSSRSPAIAAEAQARVHARPRRVRARSSTATRSSTSTWATRSRPTCPASCASSARPTTSSAPTRPQARVLPPLPRPAPVRRERRRRPRRARARTRTRSARCSSSSSLPCTELWVNRQQITGKLPDKGIVVAPGSYKGLCFNPKYEMALFEYATVEAGQAGGDGVPLGDRREQARAARSAGSPSRTRRRRA